MIIESLKGVVNTILEQFGYKIKRHINPWKMLDTFNFRANTILDVGVCKGTPELYSAFPEAYLMLFDPLKESKEIAEKEILLNREGEFIMTAVGAEKKEAIFNVFNGLASSSFHQDTSGHANSVGGKNILEKRQVSVQTLDQLLKNKKYIPTPYGLKINTEGHDLEVLKGAKETLKKCSFCISEVPINDKYEDSFKLSDMLDFMDENNFKIHTFLQANPNENGIVRGADILFINKNISIL